MAATCSHQISPLVLADDFAPTLAARLSQLSSAGINVPAPAARRRATKVRCPTTTPLPRCGGACPATSPPPSPKPSTPTTTSPPNGCRRFTDRLGEAAGDTAGQPVVARPGDHHRTRTAARLAPRPAARRDPRRSPTTATPTCAKPGCGDSRCSPTPTTSPTRTATTPPTSHPPTYTQGWTPAPTARPDPVGPESPADADVRSTWTTTRSCTSKDCSAPAWAPPNPPTPRSVTSWNGATRSPPAPSPSTGSPTSTNSPPPTTRPASRRAGPEPYLAERLHSDPARPRTAAARLRPRRLDRPGHPPAPTRRHR